MKLAMKEELEEEIRKRNVEVCEEKLRRKSSQKMYSGRRKE